jgi:hypothetical protein
MVKYGWAIKHPPRLLGAAKEKRESFFPYSTETGKEWRQMFGRCPIFLSSPAAWPPFGRRSAVCQDNISLYLGLLQGCQEFQAVLSLDSSPTFSIRAAVRLAFRVESKLQMQRTLSTNINGDIICMSICKLFLYLVIWQPTHSRFVHSGACQPTRSIVVM